MKWCAPAAVFGQAAAAWRALSDEQRQAFSQRYAADNDDPALDDLPEPEADAEAEAKPTATLTDAAKSAEKACSSLNGSGLDRWPDDTQRL